MSLSEYQIRAAKTKETPYKLTDGQGLTLLVSPIWRRACGGCGIGSVAARR